jgi:adenylyltransferase/sulfurtransferase
VHLPFVKNVPYTDLKQMSESELASLLESKAKIFLMCRRGNESKICSNHLVEQGYGGKVFNILGGLDAYSAKVDPEMPMY